MAVLPNIRDWRAAQDQSGDGVLDYLAQAIIQGRLVLPASGDKLDMCKARAQAIMPPEFSSWFNDYLAAPTDYTDSAYASSSQQLYGMPSIGQGISGGSKNRFRESTAAGFHWQTLGTHASQVAILCQNQTWNPWYIEAGVMFLAAQTGTTSEVGIVGMYVPESPMAITDGAGGAYVSLGVFGSVSLTTLTLRVWDGAVLTLTATTIPVEVSPNVFRRFALANDGLGSLLIIRDGVVMQTASVFPNSSYLPGAPFFYGRSGNGATDIVRDYMYAAGATY